MSTAGPQVSPGARSRDPRYDNAKGVLIILVVMGHILMKAPELSGWHGGGFWSALYCAIYVVHMPVFVFLSGFFTSAKKKITEHVRELLLLFVAAQVAWSLYSFVLSIGKVHAPLVGGFLFALPGNGLWYLLALFCWRAATPILTQLRFPSVVLAGLIVYGAAIGLVENVGLEFSLSRIICFFPLFAAGFWSRQNDWFLTRNNFTRKDLLILAVGLVSAFLVWKMAYRVSLDLLTMARPVSTAGVQLRGVAFRLLFYVSALGAARAFILTAPRGTGLLTKIGENSLSIYLGHFYLLLPLEIYLSPTAWVEHLIWIAPLFIAVSCALFCLVPVGDYFRMLCDTLSNRAFTPPALEVVPGPQPGPAPRQ
jgi:fucose 4-O-acetylase-like acetyltransferase